jgi:PTS system nitrogen regulatory IIA component
MQLQTILTPRRTLNGAQGSSKKRVFEAIADFICNDVTNLDSNELFIALNAREKLGSTGIGKGIAIPHCRIKNCSTTTGALIKLQQAIDFDAIDDEPVDLMFVLLVPEEATDKHLQTLATLASLFNQAEFCQSLRDAESNEELYNAAINYQQAA